MRHDGITDIGIRTPLTTQKMALRVVNAISSGKQQLLSPEFSGGFRRLDEARSTVNDLSLKRSLDFFGWDS